IREQEVLNLLVGDCRQSTMDCLKETAFSERPEIKIMTLQKEIAEDSVTYARGSYWPDISLEGVYLRQENEPSSAPGLNERIYGILKLDFPLFEGGLRIAEVREAKARLRQVEQRLSDLTHSVSVEVENSYLNLRTVSSVIIQLQAEATYAGDNYNAVAKQFQHGLADSIDIIDANTLLVTAERELSNAKYDYMLAVLKLKRATGRLLKTAISHDLSTVSTEEDKENSSNK
ncbi:MAG: TolC family protein, partial [Thermodesulfovibrionia bacterium]|nr:TolC family protein [Thermodesulfovibrionia bacterium]